MHDIAKAVARSLTAPQAARRVPALEAQIEKLKSCLRLAVIFGGDKLKCGSVIYETQNSRSWKSYEAVAQDIADALRRIGFVHVQLMPDDMNLGDRLRRDGIHMAWLNSGGVQGYNPTAHASAMLEMMGVPYVGHDPLAATTLDNKHAFKREALCAGFPTAPFSTWHMARGPFCPESNSRFLATFGDHPGPFVVKPVSGRASLHVHLIERRDELPEAIAAIHEITGDVVLIEKYLPGREFCIAACGPVTAKGGSLLRGGGPFTFAALERVLAPDEKIFTSMDVRPITGARCRPIDPQCESELLDKLHDLARKIFLEFNLGSVIRLDIRAGEANDLFILEANPKPDLKRPWKGTTSLICEGLSDHGMTYDDLILSLLADRLDHLLTHRAGAARHLLDLLGPGAAARSPRPAPLGDGALQLAEGGLETSVRALQQALTAVGHAESGGAFLTAASEVQSLQGFGDAVEVRKPTCPGHPIPAPAKRKRDSQSAKH